MNPKGLTLLFLIVTANAASVGSVKEEDDSIQRVYRINDHDSSIINGLKAKETDNIHVSGALEDLTNTHTAKRSNDVNNVNLKSDALYGVSEFHDGAATSSFQGFCEVP